MINTQLYFKLNISYDSIVWGALVVLMMDYKMCGIKIMSTDLTRLQEAVVMKL